MKIRPKPGRFQMSLGTRGEILGWNYLRRAGYQILEKNYRSKIGEVDLIAEKEGRLIFIEVKTRRGTDFGRPEEAVHMSKQQKLVRLAEWYLKQTGREESPVAFHVLAILWPTGQSPQIHLIENAFSADKMA